jgi:hypothetical protein
MMNLNSYYKPSQTPSGRELSRLLTAAVINKRFCNLLLTYPAKAITNGFNGESFRLARDERERVLSIRATTITDFARQLADIKQYRTYASLRE